MKKILAALVIATFAGSTFAASATDGASTKVKKTHHHGGHAKKAATK